MEAAHAASNASRRSTWQCKVPRSPGLEPVPEHARVGAQHHDKLKVALGEKVAAVVVDHVAACRDVEPIFVLHVVNDLRGSGGTLALGRVGR